jgi:hypothetical protein
MDFANFSCTYYTDFPLLRQSLFRRFEQKRANCKHSTRQGATLHSAPPPARRGIFPTDGIRGNRAFHNLKNKTAYPGGFVMLTILCYTLYVDFVMVIILCYISYGAAFMLTILRLLHYVNRCKTAAGFSPVVLSKAKDPVWDTQRRGILRWRSE